MFGIGVPELIIILLVCLLLFGATRLPEIAKSLAKSIKEFKGQMKDKEKEKRESTDSDKK